jgi:hypothetical protein
MFGYSMLYPLTDDYIDDPKISMERKKAFITRFGGLIKNGPSSAQPNAESNIELYIWDMFALIEQQFERESNQELYRLMHELFISQMDSQIQLAGPLHSDKPIPEMDPVWEVTVRKGALSTLCDLYLVKGYREIKDFEKNFAIGVGIVAQFVNDLQDHDKDLVDGQYTPFNLITTQSGEKKLDEITNSVLNYIRVIFADLARNSKSLEADVLKFLESSFTTVFFEKIAINEKHFSKSFLLQVDEASNVPSNLLKRIGKNREGSLNSMNTILGGIKTGVEVVARVQDGVAKVLRMARGFIYSFF